MISEEQALRHLIRAIREILPYNCPACGGRYQGAVNDKGICDTCFVREGHQRALYSLQEGESPVSFSCWLAEHTEELEDYGA